MASRTVKDLPQTAHGHGVPLVPLTAQLSAGQPAEELLASLQALFPTRRATHPARVLQYVDTADGRLHRRGAALTVEAMGGGVRAVLSGGGKPSPCEARLSAAPRFLWDLPPGPLRDALAPVIEVRRLLPLVDVERTETELAVLGDEAKTVVRLHLAGGRARAPEPGGAWRPLPSLLSVQPVRGYDADFERVARVVESRPGLAPADRGEEGVALEVIGRRAPGEPARPHPPHAPHAPLAPGMRADAGLRRMHHAQLDVLADNEAGVRADLDSEFLHDYRVAVRRTRSVLAQVKHVFPEVAVEHYRTEFAWLGAATGPVRDLDVLLLLLRLPGRDLPVDGLEALALFLEQEQRAAHALLVAALDEPRYGRLLTGWRRFLEEPAPPTADAHLAGRPLGAVVGARMAGRHRRMLDRGRAIGADSPPRELHALRIQAKKLRYLLDAVRPLYDEAEVERPLAVLKKLQDVLGGYHDAMVQQELLRAAGLRMAERGLADASMLMSLGRVLDRLALRGARQRERFAKRWAAFDDEPARERFGALFARHADRAP